MGQKPVGRQSSCFDAEPLENRVLLSTTRTGHHSHYIAPVVAPAYVRRRGPRHASAQAATSTTTPTPTPTATTKFTLGPEWDLTQTAGNEMESQVAVNPADPNNIAMVSQNDVNGGNTFNYAVTTDGGLVWDRITIGAKYDGFAATTPRADARVIFDAYGNLFCIYMVGPARGQVALVCLYSFDKGQHVSGMTIPVPGGQYSPDSPWLATGPSATHPGQQAVWMSFTDLKSRLILVSGINASGLGKIGTWSKPADVSDGFGTYSSIAVGPKGQIAVAWQQNEFGDDATPLLFNIDETGTGNGFGPDHHLFSSNVGGFDFIPAQPHRSVDAEVKLAYDRSGAAHNGRLYFAYTDSPTAANPDTNIFLRYSDNDGATFSKTAVRVNDDMGSKSQFLPALAVDQKTGNVALTWYDSRNSSDNTGAELFGAVSTNGGLTFSKNLQIAAAMSNQDWKGPSSNDLDYADNGTVAFLGGKLYAFWSDNSNSWGGNPQGAHFKLDVQMDVVTVS